MSAPGDPSAWLVASRDLLPAGGLALDVASGWGRNAVWLAAAGFEVVALDRNPARIAAVREHAVRHGLPVEARLADLEATPPALGSGIFDVVVVTNYLHRPLMPSIVGAVKRGGVLVYETFLAGQERRGRPTNPAFLLQAGELRRLVAPLSILREREGDFDGRLIASIVARKAWR